jgi:hypothetical protein
MVNWVVEIDLPRDQATSNEAEAWRMLARFVACLHISRSHLAQHLPHENPPLLPYGRHELRSLFKH